jgi:hypothetical protein
MEEVLSSNIAGQSTTFLMSIAFQLIAFEEGELEEQETINLFQHLIDTGMVWKLQGFYGRTAADLIDAGLCRF